MTSVKLACVVCALAVILALAAAAAGDLSRNSTTHDGVAVATGDRTDLRSSAEGRYRLDSSQSKFIAHAMAGGLFWFKGHDHLVAVKEFDGEAQLNPDQINPASLEIEARAASLAETSSVFTDPQKQIIDKELREIVLRPDQYPEITFRSTAVNGQKMTGDQYDLKITGDLTLHGVTRQITIPAKVTINGNDLRAVGEFSIDRSDFKVKATSAFHGLVQVRDRIKFEFDIAGHRIP